MFKAIAISNKRFRDAGLQHESGTEHLVFYR